MKLNSMGYLIGRGFSGMWKNRFMDFASVCILMVSLIFTGIAVLTGMNVNRIVKDIEKTNEIIIYLEEDTTDEQIDTINKKLEMISNISSITFYSKEQAFDDLKSSMTGYEELFESLGDESPLIDSFRIKVADTSLIYDTVDTIEMFDNIYTIQAPYDFANILTQIKKLVSTVSVAVIGALLIVSFVIISNSTKASVFTRRREINIMKYVGATNIFICIPFFIEGMITGIISGGLAFAVTMLAYNSLLNILTQDLSIWIVIGSKGLIPFENVALVILVTYIVSGAFVGSVGSVFSTKKYLNV
jgi:cell division transport system permease protein